VPILEGVWPVFNIVLGLYWSSHIVQKLGFIKKGLLQSEVVGVGGEDNL